MKNVVILIVLAIITDIVYAQKLLYAPQLLCQANDAKVELLYFDNNGDRYQVITLTHIDNTTDTIAVLGLNSDTSVLKNMGFMHNSAKRCGCSNNSSHYKNIRNNTLYTDSTFSFITIKKDFIFETGALVRLKKSNNKWVLKDTFEITSLLSGSSTYNFFFASNNIVYIDYYKNNLCVPRILVINEDKTLTFFSEDTTIQTGIPRLPPKH